LSELKFTHPKDQTDYASLLYVLDKCLQEDFDTQCTVFLVSDFDQPRKRSLLREKNEVNQLFQGGNDKSEGLRDLKGEGITVQLYVLNLFENGTMNTGVPPVVTNVPLVATWIPNLLAQEFIEWTD
jgi:hypothetical protein